MSNSSHSPLTGILEESEVFLDFGEYEGLSVKEVAEKDPAFYQTLITQKDEGTTAIRRSTNKTFRLFVNPASGLDH
jgi:hypothetical protein